MNQTIRSSGAGWGGEERPMEPAAPGAPDRAALPSLTLPILRLAHLPSPALEFEREVARIWSAAAGCRRLDLRFNPGFNPVSLRLEWTDGDQFSFENVAPEDWGHRAASGETGVLGTYPLAPSGFAIGEVALGGGRVPFTEAEHEANREIAEVVAHAVWNRRGRWSLQERVKELTCLYGIARLTERERLPLEEIFRRTAELIPSGWQYADIARARVTVDGREHAVAGFRLTPDLQSAEIVAGGEPRGRVEVVYLEPRPPLDEGPFQREERNLIQAIATGLGWILERRRAEEERRRLEGQLRHADRLATIGQLAAGVAHELNEPLGAILGFAQLARESAGIPDPAGRDVDRVIAAALHAREVVRKLMLFARQMPPQKVVFSLNQLVDDGLYFLASRCAASGVLLVRSLDPDQPAITADRGQIQQALVNLVVNAMQAMPGGGRLDVRTSHGPGHVALAVTDSGIGMTEEVRRQIFVPFFTTKEVGHGTGLGLSVVHGIVSAHGGDIEVETRPGAGSTFTIRLPRETSGETPARPAAGPVGGSDERGA